MFFANNKMFQCEFDFKLLCFEGFKTVVCVWLACLACLKKCHEHIFEFKLQLRAVELEGLSLIFDSLEPTNFE